MRTVVLGPRPEVLERLIEERRARGADLYDEVWEGEYHMSPAPSGPHAVLDDQVAVTLHPRAKVAGLVGSGPFNLGTKDDYRVPDRGYHRAPPKAAFASTAAIVVEILSPDDETFEKFEFYARHGVEEIFVVDQGDRSVSVFVRGETGFSPSQSSELLRATAAALAEGIEWPD